MTLIIMGFKSCRVKVIKYLLNCIGTDHTATAITIFPTLLYQQEVKIPNYTNGIFQADIVHR